MDQKSSNSGQKSANKNLLLIFIIVIILLIIGAGAGFYFISQNENNNQNTNQNQNLNTSQTSSFQNINGKLICGESSECPSDYSCVSVYAVSGAEEKLCVRNDSLNVNGAINTNVNFNVNQNLNQNTNRVSNQNVNATPVEVADWRTVNYQRYDHGFSIDLPSDWSASYYSMGMTAGENFFSVYEYGEDGYLDLGVQFISNSGSLSDWVTERQQLFQEDIGDTLAKESKTVNGEEAYLLSGSYTNNDQTFYNQWQFLQKDDRVYQISVTGNGTFYQQYLDEIDQILESFKFIDPMPLVAIALPASKSNLATGESYSIEVNWLNEPEALNISEPIFQMENSYISTRDYYKVGTITNGRYQGMDLVNILELPIGPAFGKDIYRVVYDSEAETFTYLEKHSNNLSYFQFSFTYDSEAEVADLDLPETITIPNSGVYLKEELYNENKIFASINDLVSLFTDSTAGEVYFDPAQNCFVIETPDHLIKQYYLKLDFIEDFAAGEYMLDFSSFVPQVTWTGGTEVDEEYTYNEMGGCGSRDCHAIYTSEELGGESALEVTGQTSTGSNVYEFIDSDNKKLQDMYDLYYDPDPENKVTYEEFAADHPVFFWKDPFGHWVRFHKLIFMPMVECGKPVIYLYPETETEVNVQVDPTGGFSITEPEYPQGGWNVTANPDGRLEYSDGNQYPYLFWEGKGINYKIPEKGFVILREQVKPFLSEKLVQLGLNEKESAEFMEFWVPRMQAKPYYFVTFINQTKFNRLAPLKVDPQPDTVIRVFMDYRGLAEPVTVEPLKIVTPERKGFTVVEWGGALHK